ncbi:unnamed protein product [Cylicocyclus nassatus]|uniref:7TM GPCR serpentine receptor class x (Srx) domain-containing protein n=1 Tax=Cylicocyclus nassatus TaxID=53992 RepID=A0AA36H516_CYLNA|nr:unnamed protein product [Cylicocyclus nassatus]
MVGMYRGKLLKIPCYKLMFYNGFVDIGDLILCSYITPYFHFTVAVFCSSKSLDWISGHLVYSLWMGASFNCMILAFDRFVEMVPAANVLKFLFRGKLLYMWMTLSLLYMLVVWFVLRPIPFNTVVSAFIGTPLIANYETEYYHYTSFYLVIHNSTVVIMLVTLYSVLYYYVRNALRRGGNIDDMPVFVQVFFVCTSTGATAILYVLLELLAVPRSVVIAAHVVWQLSHGVHGIVYLRFNKHIRQAVFALFVKGVNNDHSTNAIFTSKTKK